LQLFQEALKRLKEKENSKEIITEILFEIGEIYLKWEDRDNLKTIVTEITSLNPENDEIKKRLKKMGFSE